ncbi:MAG: GDP-mannose 4,6-dehydratase [Verrucomicrobiota bacterium]
MKKALITGATGQDGSYLTEFLLDKDYEVHGIVRRASTFNRLRIEHLISDSQIYNKRLFLHYCDLHDATTLRRIISKVVPDEFYHLAGQSHPGLSFEIPESTCEEVSHATLRILEICRDQDSPPRIYHASTSEIFGAAESCPQNERTSRWPTSPYGAAKAFSTNLCEIYRKAYGLFVCNGIAYNHESPRRGESFVTMKICREVAKIKLGLEKDVTLGDTSARRDWGYAPEYVDAMWRSLQANESDDYVLATGKLHSVKDLIEMAFAAVELKPEGRVQKDPRLLRPVEPVLLQGDPSRAKEKLGWKSEKPLGSVIAEMVESQVDLLRRL